MSIPTPQVRTAPSAWRYSADSWRLSARATPRLINTALRLFGGRVLPSSLRDRIHAIGIPDDVTAETLSSIRHLDGWHAAWIETAQRFLGDYRRQISADMRHDAAQSRLTAGLCYHVAQLLPGPDARTLAHCRTTAATLVAQALPDAMPHARQVAIPWRNHELPALFVPGPDVPGASGLVVAFCGTTTTKEEMLRWGLPFGRVGIAALYIDTPGTGEAHHLGPISPDFDDVCDGVFDLLRDVPTIDPRRVGVLGAGLGGNLAIRSLVYDRRLAGAAVVTPVYDPARWVSRAAPLTRAELEALLGTEDNLVEAVAPFSLDTLPAPTERPVLIIGAGRDTVVPPGEATRLAERLGRRSTLSWYPHGGHILYREIAAWSTDVAFWFAAVLGEGSTRVEDDEDMATRHRAVLFLPPEPPAWNESEESARLIDRHDVFM